MHRAREDKQRESAHGEEEVGSGLQVSCAPLCEASDWVLQTEPTMESPPTTGEVRLALSTALGISQECGGRKSRDAESLTLVLALASGPKRGWQG